MAEPLVLVEGVTKSFGREVVTKVLHGIDLELFPAEFTALVGPSGSGKSTLLNLLGLLDRPTSGRIVLQGRDTTDLGDDERSALRGRSLGFVFQFHHLLPAFTALENVMMPMLAARGREEARMRDRAFALLDEIGLADRASYGASKLSGGQQQRVAVARALVLEPPLVLADEPTGNLDTESGAQVFELLRRVSERHRTAFLVVTHDERIAARCDRVLTMVDGRIRSDERQKRA
ncbi:MAG: ABC transporter ATP-binding protein [Thermoanaerobaculia bacterium]|jgi:ABC-type antimicrobial peptide transport system, ATPase component|nr:ABC transporter ATP-binding protein [Thermoanaerobaculia bacterium]